jgi:sec-independent protein translocase protein TatA
MGLDNPLHIAALVVLVLLVFGARRLPEIGRSLGSGMREFKEAVTGESKSPATPTLGTGDQSQASAQAQPSQPATSQAPPTPEPVATQVSPGSPPPPES